MKRKLPTVYSCSGGSPVAQLANELACNAHNAKMATMSCIAGVGGNVPALVKVAAQSETIIAIDGCQLHCVKSCLDKIGVTPTHHIDLSKFNIKKNKVTDEDFVKIWIEVLIPMLKENNE